MATRTAPTAPTADLDALELLSGDARNFVEKVWASHVHVHKTDPADLVGLLSFDDVDELLTATAIRTPAVRLAKDGKVLAQSLYTRRGATLAGQALTGLVDARKVIDLFEDGATVVLQGLHRYWPPLARLVAELELALGHPCQANAYLTPPGSQGFAVHSDTHDVFVFQTHGSKLWEVHPAPGDEGEATRRAARAGPEHVPPHRHPARRPRAGHGVAARDDRDQPDHLAHPARPGRPSGPRRRSRAPTATSPPATSTIPTGWPRGWAGACATWPRRWAAPTRRRSPTNRPAPSWRSGAPTCAAPWSTGCSSTPSPATTELRRRPGKPCVLRPDGDRLHLLLGDRRMTVPARITDAVERVRTLEAFTPDDLGLDPESALVLSRRLIREGLLEVVR